MKEKGATKNEGIGSIPWTAPEILNESPDVNYVLTDVYAFGK